MTTRSSAARLFILGRPRIFPPLPLGDPAVLSHVWRLASPATAPIGAVGRADTGLDVRLDQIPQLEQSAHDRVAVHGWLTLKSAWRRPSRRSVTFGSSSKYERPRAKSLQSARNSKPVEIEVGGAIWDHATSSTSSNGITYFDCGAIIWYSGWLVGRVLSIVICMAAVTMCQWYTCPSQIP